MPTKSILLIEHEAGLREVLYVCLRELGGWEVTPARSIRESIDLCTTLTLDAILLDTSTSGGDALIFIEELKRYCMTQSIPIVLMSDRANWFTEEQLNQIGFAGAIMKPFNPSTIPTQISRLLGWDFAHEP
jgi:CheY-like chemotaxis protein